MRLNQQFNFRKFTAPAEPKDRLIAALCLLAIIGIFVFFYTVAYKDVDFERCGFEQRYSLPCPTCGMTSSMAAFVHLRLLGAFYIQPAAAVVCWLLVAGAICSLLIAVFGVKLLFIPPVRMWQLKYIFLIFMIIIIGGWAVTLARAYMKLNGS